MLTTEEGDGYKRPLTHEKIDAAEESFDDYLCDLVRWFSISMKCNFEPAFEAALAAFPRAPNSPILQRQQETPANGIARVEYRAAVPRGSAMSPEEASVAFVDSLIASTRTVLDTLAPAPAELVVPELFSHTAPTRRCQQRRRNYNQSPWPWVHHVRSNAGITTYHSSGSGRRKKRAAALGNQHVRHGERRETNLVGAPVCDLFVVFFFVLIIENTALSRR